MQSYPLIGKINIDENGTWENLTTIPSNSSLFFSFRSPTNAELREKWADIWQAVAKHYSKHSAPFIRHCVIFFQSFLYDACFWLLFVSHVIFTDILIQFYGITMNGRSVVCIPTKDISKRRNIECIIYYLVVLITIMLYCLLCMPNGFFSTVDALNRFLKSFLSMILRMQAIFERFEFSNHFERYSLLENIMNAILRLRKIRRQSQECEC